MCNTIGGVCSGKDANQHADIDIKRMTPDIDAGMCSGLGIGIGIGVRVGMVAATGIDVGKSGQV